MNWSKEQLDAAWRKGQIVAGMDSRKYRQDAAGAMMYYESRDNTPMAWEVDHIFPKEILEYFEVPDEKINDNENLRAMHHSNNSSKGISFPKYSSSTMWDEELEKNVSKQKSNTVNDKRISILRKLFESYLGMTLEEAVQVYEDEH